MRRSGRNRTKSLKAELEYNAQHAYKLIKLHGQRKTEGKCAPIRTDQDASEDERASDSEEEEPEPREEGSEEDDIVEPEVCSGGSDGGEGTSFQSQHHTRSTRRRDAMPRKDDRELEPEDVEEEEEEDVGEEEEEEEVSCGGGDGGMGRWRHYPSLCSSLPGRERQIHLLLSLMGEPNAATCPAMHVYGNASTGKTLTLKTILETLQVPHAFINCIECYSPKLLYRTILDQLSGGDGSTKCDNLAMFIRLLQRCTDQSTDQTIYIVLDRAERLREMEPTLLPALLRLSELTHRSVCTILASQLVWEKFPMDTGGLTPFPLHFPQYTKSEVLTVMAMDCPDGEPLSFYKTYINHIWNVFQSVCRDLGELRYLSSLLYPKYCEPVEAGEIGRQETRKLWRHIEPYFRGVMSKIHLREISTTQWERAQGELEMRGASTSSLTQGLGQSKCVLELPYYSKYLLIASYLASYNPSKTDKKFFSKQKQVRTRKSKKSTKDKPNYQLIGPKSFPLDRLMAIFYSIIEESIAPSASIYSQISSLVTLQLIGQLNSRDPLDGPKYKCLMTLDAVLQVARTIGFDLTQYLYDFN